MGELKEIREKILVNIREVAGANKEKIEDAYKRVMKLERIALKQSLTIVMRPQFMMTHLRE